jgi:hypothetical protein
MPVMLTYKQHFTDYVPVSRGDLFKTMLKLNLQIICKDCFYPLKSYPIPLFKSLLFHSKMKISDKT